MTGKIDRRHVIGGLVSGGGVAVASAALAKPAELAMKDLKKESEVAVVYHCDFADPQRYSVMLRNINNHLSVYDFDPFETKIVIVAHGGGVAFHLKNREGTSWAGLELDPTLDARMRGLAAYGVEVYLCKITFQLENIDLSKVKDDDYIRLVPSGVATVADLQAKGFSYIKVG